MTDLPDEQPVAATSSSTRAQRLDALDSLLGGGVSTAVFGGQTILFGTGASEEIGLSARLPCSEHPGEAPARRIRPL